MSYLTYNSCASCHGPTASSLFLGLMENTQPAPTHEDGYSWMAVPSRDKNNSYLKQMMGLINEQIAPLATKFDSEKNKKNYN